MRFVTSSVIFALLLSISSAFTADQPSPVEAVLKRMEESRGNGSDHENKAYETALAEIDKLLFQTPGLVEAHYHRGRILFYVNRDTESEEAYQAVLKINQNHVAANFMIGVLYLYNQRLKEAESQFQQVIKLDAAHLNARMELAGLLTKSKRKKAALIQLEEVIKLEPRHPEANFETAIIISNQGERKQALTHFRIAHEEAPDKPFYIWNLAQCLQLLGQTEEALELFLAFDQEKSKDWRTYQKIIQSAENLGKKKLRYEWIKKIVSLKDSGNAPELAKQGFFIRDQFTIGEYLIFGMEYFKLTGDRAVKYSFQCENKAAAEKEIRISLGSYDITNKMAHELGEVAEGTRRFHLDGYTENAHFTFDFFNGNPGYDRVKVLVIDVLEERRKAISSTTYGKGKTTIKFPTTKK